MISFTVLFYLDEEGNPVPSRGDDPRYHEWYGRSWVPGPRCRRVAEDYVTPYRISTVFLSINHQFGNGPPVLWETMVFCADESDPWHEYTERYTSREAALAHHKCIVEAVTKNKSPEDL